MKKQTKCNNCIHHKWFFGWYCDKGDVVHLDNNLFCNQYASKIVRVEKQLHVD